METNQEANQLFQVIREFSNLTRDLLEGRNLRKEQIDYYRQHPQEWHRRMFDLLVTAFIETRKLYQLALGGLLANATHVAAGELYKAIKFPPSTRLGDAADCWEIDRERAYREFGPFYEFPFPSDEP